MGSPSPTMAQPSIPRLPPMGGECGGSMGPSCISTPPTAPRASATSALVVRAHTSRMAVRSSTSLQTRGDSGGPLLVKTGSGKWSIAGINDLVVIPNDVYNGAIPQAFGRVDSIRPWIEGKIAQFG